MRIIDKRGSDNCALVYFLENSAGKRIETVESFPTGDLSEKYVLIISSLFGCPVKCGFCDAALSYRGRLSKEELLEQVRLPLLQRFQTHIPPTRKFKVQFSRMGEPAFNPAVLEAIRELLTVYRRKIVISVSTVAPRGSEKFLEQLLEIKRKFSYQDLQLQFSLHSTDESWRDRLIPVPKLGFAALAAIGGRFRLGEKDKKVTLNFALTTATPFDARTLNHYFDPRHFFIKITPVNPTFSADQNNISSLYRSECDHFKLESELEQAGYEYLVSIGNLEENRIGSNCGQYLEALERSEERKIESVEGCKVASART